MVLRISYIIATGIMAFSCGSGENSSHVDEIEGVYAREYSTKVVNVETGNEIGTRTIRDTIIIRPKDNCFLVVNRKWRLNDYDNEGWQNMEHAEDRSIPAFSASFNAIDNSLGPQRGMAGVSFTIDLKTDKLYSASQAISYTKIK